MAPGELNARYSITRIRDRFSERRARRRLRALAILLAGGLVTTQVFPTLAENVSGGNQSNSDTATVTTTLGDETPTVTSVDTEADHEQSQADGTDSEPTESPEPLPPPPPSASENQSIFITMPPTMRVDPRAASAFLPRVAISSSNTLLACITSASLRFDLGATGVVDDSETEGIMISGDRSNSVLIAGAPDLVSVLINSEKGLRIFREDGGVSGHIAVFRFIDISEPALDEALCSDGATSNHRVLQLLPLGLTQSITKAKVGLEKGKKG